MANYTPSPITRFIQRKRDDEMIPTSTSVPQIQAPPAPNPIVGFLGSAYGKVKDFGANLADQIDAATQIASQHIKSDYIPLVNLPDIIYGGVNTIQRPFTGKDLGADVKANSNIFVNTDTKALQAGEQAGHAFGNDQAGEDIGRGLRGAYSITPFRQWSPDRSQYDPTTDRQRTAEDIGRNAFALAATAPLAGTGSTFNPLAMAGNVGSRAVQGALISGGIQLGKNAITGKPLTEDLGKAAVHGIENSWQLAIANALTGKALEKFAPAISKAGIDASFGKLGELSVGNAPASMKWGVVAKEIIPKLFARALAETPAETAIYTGVDKLTGREKDGFAKAFIKNLGGVAAGNLAFAGLEGGTRGVYNFNKRDIQIAQDAIAQAWKDVMGDQRGFIRVSEGDTISNPEQLASAIKEEYNLQTSQPHDPNPTKLSLDDVVNKISSKYNLTPELEQQLRSGQVIDGNNFVMQNQNGKLQVTLMNGFDENTTTNQKVSDIVAAKKAEVPTEIKNILDKLPEGQMTKSGSVEGKYLTPEVQDTVQRLMNGEDKMSVFKSVKNGVMQEAQQRMSGLGLLADLDEALKQKNYGDVRQIVEQMVVDPRYAQYTTPENIKSYLSGALEEAQSQGVKLPTAQSLSAPQGEPPNPKVLAAPTGGASTETTPEQGTLFNRDEFLTTVSPEQAKQIYAQTGRAVPFVNQLGTSPKAIALYEPNTDLAEVQRETKSFFGQLADETVNNEQKQALVMGAYKTEQDMEEVLNGFKEADTTEKGLLNSSWRNALEKVGDVTHINDAIDKAKELLRPFTKYQFTDQELDDYATKLTLYQFGMRDKFMLDYQQARRDAEDLVGRSLNETELGAILRQEVPTELARQEAGVTLKGEPIGKDVADKADELYKFFVPVHEDKAAIVLAYEKIVDEAAADGRISYDKADKMKLVPVDDFVNNIDQYLRTTYDRNVWQIDQSGLYEPAMREVQLTYETSKTKLTDREWGQAYINAANKYEVTKGTAIPEDLLAKVEMGDEGAISDLGRRVKEMRGYIYDGTDAYRRTVNNLLEKYHDVLVMDYITKRPDLSSPVPTDTMTKQLEGDMYSGLMGNYYTKPQVFDDLQSLYKERSAHIGEAWEMVRWGVGWWKFSKVPLNLPSYLNNYMYGTVLQQYYADNSVFNPMNAKYYAKGYADIATALRDPRNVSPELEDFITRSGYSGTFADDEINKFLVPTLDDTKTLEDIKNIPDTLPKKLYKALEENETYNNALDKAAIFNKAYGILDVSNKYILYLNKIDNGYTPEESVLLSHKYMFNYDLLPQWLRNLRDRSTAGTIGQVFAPFFSFQAKNIPLKVDMLVNKPWKPLGILAAIGMWNVLQKSLHTPEVARQAEQFKPYYYKNNPYVALVGYDKEKKQWIYWDFGLQFLEPFRWDAHDTLAQNLGANASTATSQLASPIVYTGGVLSGVSEAARGFDQFGRPLNQPFGESSVDAILRDTLPIPPVVFKSADFINAVRGNSSSVSGRVMPVGDAALKVFGVNLQRGDARQFSANLSKLISDFQSRQSIYKKQLTTGNKDKAIQMYKDDIVYYKGKIKEYMAKETDASPNVIENMVNGIMGILVKDAEAATIPQVTPTNPLPKEGILMSGFPPVPTNVPSLPEGAITYKGGGAGKGGRASAKLKISKTTPKPARLFTIKGKPLSLLKNRKNPTPPTGVVFPPAIKKRGVQLRRTPIVKNKKVSSRFPVK